MNISLKVSSIKKALYVYPLMVFTIFCYFVVEKSKSEL